mgnify:FL=1
MKQAFPVPLAAQRSSDSPLTPSMMGEKVLCTLKTKGTNNLMVTIMAPMYLKLQRIFRNSVRLYFAPLVGAFKGARAEIRMVLRDIERDRQASRTAE